MTPIKYNLGDKVSVTYGGGFVTTTEPWEVETTYALFTGGKFTYQYDVRSPSGFLQRVDEDHLTPFVAPTNFPTDFSQITGLFTQLGVPYKLLGAPGDSEMYEAPECKEGRLQVFLEGSDTSLVFDDDERYMGTLTTDAYHGSHWNARHE
jgi:hypothetical protein